MRGDSSLWYRLAEANGLTAASALVDGQSLTVPAGVTNNGFSASTFRPYDPAEAVGETSPTSPKPNKKNNKCGVFGVILLVAIAVAVSVVTAGAALAALAPASAGIGGIGAGITALATGVTATGVALSTAVGAGTLIAAGAVGGAVGSIVSQGVGVATGLQDKFSWKQVALAGLSGGIGAGVGSMMPVANGMFQTAVRGAAAGLASSFLTQSIASMTGLQRKFDWAGVAAATVGGAASGAVGANLGGLNRHLASAISSSAGAIANAATRSLVNGSSFGDNLLAALPDVIGSTLGNMIAEGVQSLGGGSGRGNGANAARSATEAGGNEGTPLNGTEQDIGITGSRGRTMTDAEWEATFAARNAEAEARIEAEIAAEEAATAAAGPVAITIDTYRSLQGGAPGSRMFDWLVDNFDNSDIPGFLDHNRDDYGLHSPNDYYELAGQVIQQSDDTGEFDRLARLVLPMSGNFAADPQFGELWAPFRDRIRGHVDARNSVADRAVWDVLDSVLPTQAATGAVRWFRNGERNAENGVAMASPILGGVGKPVSMILGRLVGKAGDNIAASAISALRLRAQLLARSIADGHAFDKHVLGVGNPQGNEFAGLGIRTRNQFAAHLEEVILRPSQSGTLLHGREYFYHRGTNTIVIRNPRAPDGGTAFRPVDPDAYLRTLR